jgi:hypothetical protein
MANQESLEYNTQVRSPPCGTGWCSSTLKKTFPLRRRRNARRASGNRTRTALSDALKTQSPLVGRRSKSQRNLIEVGRAIYGTDSMIHYMLRRTSMWQIRITMTTSLRRNHQCVKACYTTLGATPGNEPGDLLLRRDPTPAAAKPRNSHLGFPYTPIYTTHPEGL